MTAKHSVSADTHPLVLPHMLTCHLHHIPQPRPGHRPQMSQSQSASSTRRHPLAPVRELARSCDHDRAFSYTTPQPTLNLQLGQHTHSQVLRDLLPHGPFGRLGEMTLRVELADVSRLELFGRECGFFLHGFGVCRCEREHFLCCQWKSVIEGDGAARMRYCLQTGKQTDTTAKLRWRAVCS